MKKMLLFGLSLLLLNLANAQMRNPVQWTFAAKKIDASTYEVMLTASMEEGWHIYSQTTPAGGPVPTAIQFTKNPLLTITGPAKEKGKLEQRHEKLFGVDVKQYSNQVAFVQTVTVKGKAKTALNGSVKFMTCDDKECLPPKTQTFTIALP